MTTKGEGAAIPDEAVEAAAKAIFGDPTGETWALQLPEVQERSREDARLALEAAAPLLTAAAWDDGYGHGYKHGKEDCMRLMPGPA